MSLFRVYVDGALFYHPHMSKLAITITFSFFEAFIHPVGIKIHRLTKPYTPGLVTAWCMAAVGVVAVITLNRTGMAAAKDYVLGAVFWLLSFVCMDIVIIAGFGKSPAEILATVKGQRQKQTKTT